MISNGSSTSNESSLKKTVGRGALEMRITATTKKEVGDFNWGWEGDNSGGNGQGTNTKYKGCLKKQ